MKRNVAMTVILLAAAAIGGCSDRGMHYLNSVPVDVDPTKAYTDARYTLRQAAEDSEPETRAHALEAMAKAAPMESGPLFKQALGDPSPLVRFAAAMAIGDTRYEPALEDLQNLARIGKGERDRRVYPAIVYALFNLGDMSHVNDLVDLLRDKEPEVRANAALVMGRLGEPSAIRPLKMLLDSERDENARFSLREALAVLGDPASVSMMESYARGYYLDLRLAAVPVLANERSHDSLLLLRDLTNPRNPTRVRVLAADGLARLGEVDEINYNMCLNSLVAPDKMMELGDGSDKIIIGNETDSLQRLAAMALGNMGQPASVPYLHRLLREADTGSVTVAAAMSLVQLLKPIVDPEPAHVTEANDDITTPPPTQRRGNIHFAGGKD